MTKPVNDIEIILPDGEVVIAGERLTVREYSLRDTMRLYHHMDGLIHDIADKLSANDDITLDESEQLFAKHYESIVHLIACSIDKPIDFIESLSPYHGYLLMDTWWQVNSPFFINAAARKIFRREAEQKTKQQIGDLSLQPLSNQGTTPSE